MSLKMPLTSVHAHPDQADGAAELLFLPSMSAERCSRPARGHLKLIGTDLCRAGTELDRSVGLRALATGATTIGR